MQKRRGKRARSATELRAHLNDRRHGIRASDGGLREIGGTIGAMTDRREKGFVGL